MRPATIALDIAYSGKINTQANGLFALDYTDVDGKPARALFTQFEAADARRFVPSWDEPDYKATFDLTARVPANQMAVGNMPAAASKDLGGGLKEVTLPDDRRRCRPICCSSPPAISTASPSRPATARSAS